MYHKGERRIFFMAKKGKGKKKPTKKDEALQEWVKQQKKK